MTCTVLLRIPSAMMWVHIIDRYPHLHGVLTGLLTAIGALGILLILSVPPHWTIFILPAAIVSCLLDGFFFQSIEVVIDSAIIKILNDYKILYGHERKWGKYTSALMMLVIAYFLKDDHDFDTLIIILLLGSVALFLLSLSTSVQSADPTLLLGKQPLLNPEIVYKPYHLFGEHLSHISEEDASMLQRITTTHSKFIPSITDLYPSFELARLPFPPVSSSSIVVLSLFRSVDDQDEQEKRIERSILLSLLFLGTVYGMTQSMIYLFLYDTFKVPMPILGLVGFMMIMSSPLAEHWFHRVSSPPWIIPAFSYVALLSSTIAYMYLIPDTILTLILVVFLQLCQGLSFHFIWLSAIQKVNTVLLTDDKRIILKGSMSAVYSHLGYALGILITGYLLTNQVYSIYEYSIPLTLLSAILTWEWSFCE